MAAVNHINFPWGVGPDMETWATWTQGIRSCMLLVHLFVTKQQRRDPFAQASGWFASCMRIMYFSFESSYLLICLSLHLNYFISSTCSNITPVILYWLILPSSLQALVWAYLQANPLYDGYVTCTPPFWRLSYTYKSLLALMFSCVPILRLYSFMMERGAGVDLR